MDADSFDREHKVMSLFIDNAKTYTQLSIGALVLSITFVREVLALPKDTPVQLDWQLVTCWTCFLSAVICGSFYQYLAAKFIEKKAGVPRTHRIMWDWIVDHPWLAYGLMLISFYGGAVFFTAGAIHRLR
jgi:hypothetical protein